MLIDNQLNSFATLEVDNAGRNYGSISKQKIKTRFSLLAKAIAADAKLVMLSGGSRPSNHLRESSFLDSRDDLASYITASRHKHTRQHLHRKLPHNQNRYPEQ